MRRLRHGTRRHGSRHGIADEDDEERGGLGSLSIIGIWTGPEQKRFQAVLDGFEKLYPNVSVKYTSGGDNTPTILSTAIQGGNPPDLASIGQPGLLRDFANQGARRSALPARRRHETTPTD